MSNWFNGALTPEGLKPEDLKQMADTHAERLMALLWDLQPHHTEEMERHSGHRFGSGVHVIRMRGYEIRTVMDEDSKGAFYTLMSRKPGPRKKGRIRLYLDPGYVELLASGHLPAEVIGAAQEALSDA